MPADARLLLRAAVASSSAQPSSENGIKDRFASYHPKTRALRCTACDYLTIKHESLWASHAASKSHRNNVTKSRREQEEKARQAYLEAEREENALQGREKREESETGNSTGSKRKERGADEESIKRVKISESNQQSLPVDAEWERFQREVLDAANTVKEQPSLSSYANATIEVRPELNSGFGGSDMDEEEQEEEEFKQKAVETEAERRTRLDREDREEILARLEEEQRVQDEADERVNALKSRFEKLKQARAAKKR